jgi:hypothetical protein
MMHTQNIMPLLNTWLQSYSTFQGEDNFRTLHTRGTHIGILEQKFINYDMDVYLEKDRTCVTIDMTATHATAKQLIKMWKDMDINYMWATSFHQLTYQSDKKENQLLWGSHT